MKKIARRLDLPYPIEKVWDTALSVLDHAGWEITHQNKASDPRDHGHDYLDRNILLESDQDWRQFDKSRPGQNRLAQPADWWISSQHIEQFLLKLESALQNVNQSVDERN